MRIEFVKQDLWIGLYWKTDLRGQQMKRGRLVPRIHRTFYLCLIPCFPIIWVVRNYNGLP